MSKEHAYKYLTDELFALGDSYLKGMCYNEYIARCKGCITELRKVLCSNSDTVSIDILIEVIFLAIIPHIGIMVDRKEGVIKILQMLNDHLEKKEKSK